MSKKKEKGPPKKKFDFPVGLKPMSKEEADAEMARFFAAIEEEYKDVPESEKMTGVRKIQDFIDGKLSWSELFGFSSELLFQMAEYGFLQFRKGNYSEAERFFKVLTVLDWNNSYYHSVMGSILQRQGRFGDAIAEYTQAIELDSGDVVSLTNRGEILLQHGLLEEARADLKRAVELDPEEKDKFANRARVLLHHMEEAGNKGEKKDKET